jgi:hypothetical protein
MKLNTEWLPGLGRTNPHSVETNGGNGCTSIKLPKSQIINQEHDAIKVPRIFNKKSLSTASPLFGRPVQLGTTG